MNAKKQWTWLAIIMMFLSLVLFTFVASHEHIFAEENEGENIQDTETEYDTGGEYVQESETQYTTQDETQDSDTINQVKQTVEDISTKIDKVDNQIQSQKVDSEKIAEQAIDIEDLKTQLGEVKATLATVNIPSYSSQEYVIDPNGFGLIKTKKYYIYKLDTTMAQSATQYRQVWYIASNSDNLQIIKVENPNNPLTYELYATGLYQQNGNTQYLIAVPSIEWAESGQYGNNKTMQIIENNDGTLTYNIQNNTLLYQNAKTIQQTGKYYYEDFDENQTFLIPYYSPSNVKYYNGSDMVKIGYCNIPNSETTTGQLYGYRYNISAYTNIEPYTFEMIKTVEPPYQEWTTEQLYMPVLIIMSILVIILFKKH